MSNSYMWHATEKDLVAIDKGRGYEIRTLHFDPDRPGHADAHPLRYDCLMYWTKELLFKFWFKEWDRSLLETSTEETPGST